MTDKETFVEMLDRAGVKYDLDANEVTITAKDGPNNKGYFGFAAVFYFDAFGALKTVSVWE